MKAKMMKLVSILLSLLLVVSLAEVMTPSVHAASKKKNKKYVVVLDPGHGVDRPGATYDGIKEEDVTLAIGKYCKEYLEDEYGFTVYMTRTGEESLIPGATELADLEARAKFAKKKKATIFVSLHINSAIGTAASGVETYFCRDYSGEAVGKQSQKLGQKIQAQLIKLGFTNRGLKTANYVVIKKTNEYNIPSVLVEHGFVRNPSDRRWMTNKTKLKKMAQADANGIAQYLATAVVKSSSDDEDIDEDDDDYVDEDGVEYYDGTKKNKSKKNESEEDEDDEEEEYYDGTGTDDEAKLNQTVDGSVYASSKIGTSGTVALAAIEPHEFNGLRLTWNPYEKAASYIIYRKTASGKKKLQVLNG